MQAVPIAAIGCSDVAWRRTLPTMAASADLDLVCVAGRDPAKAERYARRFDCAAEQDYAKALAREDIAAVYLSLPAALHVEWVCRALHAGLHVLVEKPFALAPEHAARMRSLARDRGLVLLENYAFVHHTQHERVRTLIAEGRIGDVRSFSASFTIPPKPSGDIRYSSELTGGALPDTGAYPLRAALHFLGPGLDVLGAVLRRDRGLGVVVSGGILLATPTGVPAHLSFGMEHAYRASYEVHGSRGIVEAERVYTPPAAHRPTLRIRGQDHVEELTLPSDDQLATLLGRFAEAVRGVRDVDALLQSSVELAALVRRVEDKAVLVDL